MGSDLSKSITPPPISFQDCLINGNVDIARYLYYCRKKDDFWLNKKRKYKEVFKVKKHCTKKSVKRHKILVRNEDGTLREIRPKDTLWYLLYINTPPRNKRLAKQFRLRFRMPYESFVTLSEDIYEHEIFNQWTRVDATGAEPSNIKLLLLGSLRYIGRAWTIDDIEEANGISSETNRQFLNCFIEYGSTFLYRKWVLDPAINQDICEQERLFRQAGFNGCIGSSDATHVGMLSCAIWAKIMHKGFKLNIPSRTYNMTVTHSRKILGSTLGHPATWNDKTLQLYDELLCGVRDSVLHDTFEFMLYDIDEEGNVIEVPYKGVWFMVDNGYLSWSCTVPPIKDGTTYPEIRFSEWLESMRKDVECAFGILKGRFTILRYGTRFQSITRCDQLWLTCCAIHNMLLDIDGLDENWDNGTPSNWELINDRHIETPFAISKLNRNFTTDELMQIQENVNSDMEEIIEDTSKKYDKYTVDGKRVVAKMPLHLFQQCLVRHFDIRFKRKDIIWRNI